MYSSFQMFCNSALLIVCMSFVSLSLSLSLSLVPSFPLQFIHQEFIVKGVGLPPSLLPQTVISTVLYHNAVGILSSTNPFTQNIIQYCYKTTCDQFCLFLNKHNILLESGVSLDISVMFTLDSIEQCYAIISVTTTITPEPLSWVYPVLRQPEVQPSPSY